MGCGASSDGGVANGGTAPVAAGGAANGGGPDPLTVAVPDALMAVWAAWVKVDSGSTNSGANDRQTPNPLAKVCEHNDADGPKFLHALVLRGNLTDVRKLRDARVLNKGAHYHFEVDGLHPTANKVVEKWRYCVQHDGVACTTARPPQGHEF